MKYRALFFLCLLHNFVFACDCPTLEPLSKDIASQYDIVFYGKVDSVVPCNTKGIGTAYFTIINLYKGNAEQEIIVDFDCVSSCMMSFAKNDEWIIYGTYQRFNLVTVEICSHTRKKSGAGENDLYLSNSEYSFEEENAYLKENFGTLSFVKHNAINDQQNNLGPTNEQPSGANKLLLLGISLVVMFVIYFVFKKYSQNDK